MGNVDSRSKHEAGYIYLQTSKPFYFPGEFIQGTVFLRTFHHINAKHIDLNVKGKEKGSFVD